MHLIESDSNFNRNYSSITYLDYFSFINSSKWDKVSKTIDNEIQVSKHSSLPESSASLSSIAKLFSTSMLLPLSITNKSEVNLLTSHISPATNESPTYIA